MMFTVTRQMQFIVTIPSEYLRNIFHLCPTSHYVEMVSKFNYKIII